MKNFFSGVLFFLIMSLLGNCQNADTGKNLPTSEQISISWENQSNFIAEQPRFRMVFTIINKSDYTFGSEGWALYFTISPRRVIPGSVSSGATIEHLNGDLYCLKPTPEFRLEPTDSVSITADFSDWMIKRTDAPLGLYFVFSDEEGNEISKINVSNYTIKPFDKPEQVNRFRDDETPIPTPEWRYDKNATLTLLEENELYTVLPKPVSVKTGNDVVTIGEGLMIHYEEGLENEAKWLSSMLSDLLSHQITAMENAAGGPGIIHLKTETLNVKGVSGEAYRLETGSQGINITGSDPAGLFYGMQSLISLFPIESFKSPQSKVSIKSLTISDAPAFGYRGLHLDLARNFQDKSTILKLIDLISFYKLNTLHLHLTDDEGWRLEIEELPELTEVGGFRGHTLKEEEYLHPSYGSGAFPDPEISHGSGFLSREDFKEIIKYAYERHVEIIPEVNMPGHARAAIIAMEARYRKLLNDGKVEEAEKYRLTDPEDSSEYLSAQWYDDNVICVCQESAYRFYETVVDDIIEMYEEAGVPLITIHSGGDEVPRGAWEKSPVCEKFLNENPEIEGAHNLQSYFFRKIVEMLNRKGLKIGGWEEVVMNFREDGSWTANQEFTDKNVIPYVWNSLWGNQDLGYRLANSGYPVVLCNVNNFYFDLAYNKDPKEPGLYWGGFVNERTAFEFIPFDLYKSMTVSPMGIQFVAERDFRDMERLSPDARENIIGIQAELWSETIKGQDTLEYYTLPKLLGMAQRAWEGQAEWGNIMEDEKRKTALEEDWNIFVNTIATKDLPRLDYLFGGFNYRIPLPGLKIIEDQVHANVEYPGMKIRYSTDGSEPDQNDKEYTGPVDAKGLLKFRTFNTRNQASRTSAVGIE